MVATNSKEWPENDPQKAELDAKRAFAAIRDANLAKPVPPTSQAVEAFAPVLSPLTGTNNMGSNTYPNRTELIKAAFAGDNRVTFEDCKGSFDEPMIVACVDGISGERWNQSGDGPYNKSADGIIARIHVALTPATAKPAQVVEAFTTWGDSGSKPPTASVWETEMNILRRQIVKLTADRDRWKSAADHAIAFREAVIEYVNEHK